MRVTTKRWLTELWATQAKVQSSVLNTAWHWGSDSSVVNDPLVEPVRTTLYAGLPSTWGTMDGDLLTWICLTAGGVCKI
jgi:hypothetical protein